MAIPTTLVGIVFFAVGLASILVGVVAYSRREYPGSWGLLLFAAGVTIWCLCLAVPKSISGIAYAEPFVYTILFGMQLATLGWLLFVLAFLDRLPSRRSLLFGTALYIGLGQVLVWTDPIHGLILGPETVVQDAFLFPDWQAGFWLIAGLGYGLGVFALVISAMEVLESTGYRRLHALLLVAGVIPPVITTLVTVFELTAHDMAPVGFFATLVLFTWGHRRAQLMEMVPIARKVVLDEVDDAILTIDGHDNLVDFNDSASQLLGIEDDDVGHPITRVFAEYPQLRDAVVGEDPGTARTLRLSDRQSGRQRTVASDGSTEAVTAAHDDGIHVDVNVSSIEGGAGSRSGTAVVLRDVTELKERERKLREREQELERKNERLDQFASVISHDLRNPINVAKGHLALADDGDRVESDETIRRSLERMENIIDDVLTLAREGQSIGDTEVVSLHDVAMEAWSTVDTADAELTVSDDSIRADRKRLLQLLENLYRNAVEHGGDALSIRVGVEAGMLFVEDDGTGIPPDRREDVLEVGYTTGADGTGLGLSIVVDIARGHGWAVTVTESDEGGARFEFAGVAGDRQKVA